MSGLEAFAQGFFGKIAKDRADQQADQREEEKFARRQALINKLNEESADRTESKKVKDGELVKGEDGQWYVEQLDGYGRSTGKRRPASVAEVNNQKKSGYELTNAKTTSEANVKKAGWMDEDHKLDRDTQLLQQQATREGMANARTRLSLDRQAAAGGTKEDKKDVEDIRQDWNYIVGDLEELEASGVKEAADLRMTWNEFLNSNEYKSMPMWKRKAKLAEYKGKLAGLKDRAKASS